MLLDLFIILLVIIGLYSGYKKGINRILIKTISTIGSFFLSTIFIKVFSSFLDEQFQLKEKISKQLMKFAPDMNIKFQQMQKDVVSDQLSQVDMYNHLPKAFQESIVQGILSNHKLQINLLSILSGYILHILSFIILILLFKLILKIVIKVLFISWRIPIIKQANQLLGSLLYSIHYFIIAISLACLIDLISIYTNHNIFGKSFILNYIYSYLKLFF